ncbi:MAG: class IV adenylate cyclase [Thermodesulfobacteriota bacterium]
MEHEEIEVKYHVDDPPGLRQRLAAAGAVSSGRVFEKNIRFEDAGNSLIRQKALLRLRQDNRNVLTFKQALDKGDNQFKIYREIETEVGDFEATGRILESLGYFPCQVYEKYRETFLVPGAVICLDTMPYGDFLEIEADKGLIRELTDRLGLDWNKRILATYLGLFEHVRKAACLPFTDLTFDNFRNVRFDFTAIWKRFEQGEG